MLLLTCCSNREELIGEVEVGGNLGSSDHEMVEFRILTKKEERIVAKYGAWTSEKQTLTPFRN